VDQSPVAVELNVLRRGHGLQADHLDTSQCPRLRLASGVDDTDPPHVVRQKLVLFLATRINELRGELQVAALAALALHEEANGRFLHERMGWLARYLNRDSGKTAGRWVQRAFNRLAEIIEGEQGWVPEHRESDYVPSGWGVEKLDAVVDFTSEPTCLTERREIIATADELDELLLSISVPVHPAMSNKDPIDAQMEFGGQIVEKIYEVPGHFQCVVRLPEPLKLGQRYSYGIKFTTFARELLAPYYVMLPLRRSREFRAHVRFGSEVPSHVWRLDGVPPVVLESRTPGKDILFPNQDGELKVEFFDLRPGLGYGVAWA
jgi:hypothetical protein